MSRTNIELTDMVLCYGAAHGNTRQARILYMERFPNRKLPAEGTFLSVVQRLRDCGSFKVSDINRGRTKGALSFEMEEEDD